MPKKTAPALFIALVGVPALAGLAVAITTPGGTLTSGVFAAATITPAAVAAAATFVATLAASAIIRRSVRRNTRPLRELSAVTARLADGDLDARASYSADDDDGRLAKSLNAMAEALQAHDHDQQHARDELEALFRLFDDFLFVLDDQCRIVRVNAVVELRLGYRADQLKGKPLAAIHPPELRDEAAELIDRMLDGTAAVCPIPLLAKDASTVAVETKVARTKCGGRDFIFAIAHDVSRRRRVETELDRVARERDAILDATAERIVVQDTGHRVTGASRAAAEAVGAQPHNLIGRPCYEIWAGRKMPCVDCPVDDARTTGQPRHADMTLAQGRLWTVHGRPVKDERGAVVALVEIMHDASKTCAAQARQAEQDLRESEERYRILADNITDVIWKMDARWQFTYVSPAVTDLLGYPPGQLIGTSFEPYMTPASAETSHMALAELVGNAQANPDAPRETRLVELELLRNDGSTVWSEVTVSLLLDADKQVTGAIGSVRDITPRRHADQELRAAKEQAEHAVEEVETTKASVQKNAGELAEALFQVELQKRQTETAMQTAQDANRLMSNLLASVSTVVIAVDENDRLTQWNAAAQAVFGMPPDKAIGKPIGECPIHWEDTAALEAIGACRQSGEPVRLDQIHFTRSNGSAGLLSLVVNPMRDETGRHVGLVLLGDDVTERSIMEQELARAQKLESVGALAAGIAHEINTPIQFVGDNTRFLSDSFAEFQQVLGSYHELKQAVQAQGQLQELIDRVAQAEEQADVEYLAQEIPKAIDQTLDGVARVAKIVRAMKDFSHPDQGEKAPADINHALEDTLTVAHNEIKYVADVVTQYDPELPLVPCFLSDLNQVFLNLLVNASHAIADAADVDSKNTPPEKGTITVTTSVEDNEAVIRIADSGTGIPHAVRDRVFDQFFTTKEVGKGTGQGLALAHAVIVEKHGGALTFETETDKGTTFIIRLPL